MRPLVLGTLMLHCALAQPQGQSIVDFNGPNPLAGWSIGRATGPSGASGSLIPAQGHAGRGLALEYRFNCVGSSECGVAAVWTPNQPLKIKRKGAVSMWVHAGPAVKLTLLVTDKNEGLKRYPFEAVTLENPNGDWRRVSIPLAARSTGYGDETHNGAPEGKVTSLGLLVEARYPQTLRGAVAFDDIRLMDRRSRLTYSILGRRSLRPRRGRPNLLRAWGSIYTLSPITARSTARSRPGSILSAPICSGVRRSGTEPFASLLTTGS